MSVYTPVERDQLTAFLRHYSAGELQVYEGISDGIENTHYLVSTDRQERVLTQFKTHSFDETGCLHGRAKLPIEKTRMCLTVSCTCDRRIPVP